ncbi:MAG: UDP-N-acetylmuramoyl-tripeptide--D-alanyl-D-alanine ligase [Desulfobacteraceae bacterium]|nr:UDP-N-acetylmuramoyl-tripeptide--D-alanyl-D-alanine ligase [Desulfobacteraceae bacterium]
MDVTRAGGIARTREEGGRVSADFGYGFATVQDPVWSVSQVLLATGGRFLGGRPELRFRSVSTDTRTVGAGDLFLALPGERFDGHQFIGEAVRKGATGVVVSRLPEALPPVTIILVEDTLRALGDLAAYRRSLLPHLRVVAITGSSGKTTVKEMVAAILGQRHKVLKTQGNFNNLVGLPLSLLPVGYRHDVAVLEMGMSHPGEIARLTEIADPDVACINNVQEAHLAGLGSIEGVARAKGELFVGLKSWGKMAVNLDDRRIRALARRCPQEKITFGRSPRAFVRATRIHNGGENGMAFTLHLGPERARVRLKVFGPHNVANALAAAAVAHGAGLRLPEIAAGLESFSSYDKRLQVLEVEGLKVVNDTYNANPSSMLAALEALQGLSRGRRTVVALGDMLELGRQSVAAHRFVGEAVARLGFDYLFTVGEFAESVLEAARTAGMAADRTRKFNDKREVAAALHGMRQGQELQPGDWLLIKGSRGMQMEKIIAELTNGRGGTH